MTRNKRHRNWSGALPWKIGTGAIAPVAPLPLHHSPYPTRSYPSPPVPTQHYPTLPDSTRPYPSLPVLTRPYSSLPVPTRPYPSLPVPTSPSRSLYAATRPYPAHVISESFPYHVAVIHL